MKIQKGHYVPKELITSEAVHEAVVKCFVAAGFVGRDEYGQMPCPGCFSALGVNDLSQGICWTNSGTPLTLQQLFTAENGLQWPDWAIDVRTDDYCVWFDGVGRADVISGNWSPVKSRVLATRQANASTQAQGLTHSEEGLTHSEWWDYENGCIIEGRYPPVGTKCKYKVSAFKDEACEIVAVNYPEVAFTCKRNEGRIFVDEVQSAGFHPLDHATRKAELERKRVVDAAAKSIIEDKSSFIAEYEYWLDNKKPSGSCDEVCCKWLTSRDYAECVDNLYFYLNMAYDKGYLKSQEQKK